nr:hypothetical protein GCM10025699_07810 [Microbacterium flavescens]
MSPSPARPLWQGRALALVGIVLFAFSLRSAVASLSPLFDHISAEYDVPSAVIGLIGTAPPVCYAIFGLLTPALERRFGLERLAVAAMAVVTLGLIARALAPNSGLLLAGTALIFAAVGTGNILLPPLVKRYFPDRIGLLTTVFSTTMAVATFVPPLVAVPVADAAGWRLSLGLWAFFAVLAMVPWIGLAARRRAATADDDIEQPPPGVLSRMWRRRSRGLSWSASRCRARSRTRRSCGRRRSSSKSPASHRRSRGCCSRSSPSWACRCRCSCRCW